MKFKKTFKQTYGLIRNNFVFIDNKIYQISTAYKFFIDITQYILMFLYFMIFVLGFSTFLKSSYWYIGIIIGIALVFLSAYLIEFILIFFAPLREVEAPKEGVKKESFFNRYKRYKSKRINQEKEK